MQAIAIFETTHKLDFEVRPWRLSNEFVEFKVGTCHGLYSSDKNSFNILAVINDNPGNGHTKDVFEWFEHSCRRDGKSLKVLEIMNEEYMSDLINKHGFKKIEGNNVEKVFK
jgi:hypothetical protein